MRKPIQSTAWERSRAVPGALEIVGTINGEPAPRISVAHLDLQEMKLLVREREAREAQRLIAGILRRWSRDARKLREATSRLGPWCSGVSREKCDDPKQRLRFRELVVALVDAHASALAEVPGSARDEWEYDAIDRGPTRARLDRAAAAAMARLGWPTSGRPLLDLAVSQGIAREDLGARARWGVIGARLRATGRTPRKKSARGRRNTLR